MNFLNKLSPQAHWFLRLAIGSVFLYHGFDKLGKLSALAEMMQMPVAMIAMLAMMELAAGALSLAGGFLPDWATRISGLIVVPVMLGAIMKVHWGQWSFAPSATHPMGGIEFQVTLALVALYLLVKGKKIETS